MRLKVRILIDRPTTKQAASGPRYWTQLQYDWLDMAQEASPT